MTSTDPLAAVIGPGAPFEMVPTEVRGTTLPVYRNCARNLQEILAASAQYGNTDYLVTRDERVSFTDHLAHVASLAQVLASEHGVGRGDRVAINAANSIAWLEVFWAATALGAVAVACNSWWAPRELEHGLRLTTPKVIVADQARREVLAQSGHEIPVVAMEDIPELARRHPDAALPEVSSDPQDPAVILFTSGTSGFAKGVAHSHQNLAMVVEYHRMNDALAAAFGDPTPPESKRYLLTLPLFHISNLHNLAIPRLATGSAAVMHLGAFDVDAVLSLIEKEKVTQWACVPTMATRLLEHGTSGHDLSSLTQFSLATAPSSPEMHERLRKEFNSQIGLTNSYGLTESTTGAAVATPQDLGLHPDTVGRVNLGWEITIRDAVNEVLPEGEEGEVCLRSAFNMLGYWNDTAATSRALEDDLTLHTGDIGRLEDGYLYLTSRRTDLIIRGGENVYPAEIEAVLATHPKVREVAVVGVPSVEYGQDVQAIVVVNDPEASIEELQEHCTGQLAYYKVPAHWVLTDRPLPRNATGKVMRKALPGQGGG